MATSKDYNYDYTKSTQESLQSILGYDKDPLSNVNPLGWARAYAQSKGQDLETSLRGLGYNPTYARGDGADNWIRSQGANFQTDFLNKIGLSDDQAKINFLRTRVTPASGITAQMRANTPIINQPKPAFSLTGGMLKQGAFNNENVRQLQRLLKITEDGDFGPMTKKAVMDFQRANGLTVDGIVGPKTTAALNAKFGSTSPVAPKMTPITSGVPSLTTPYTPPEPKAHAANDVYYTSLSKQVENLTAQLETERQRQLDKIQQDKQNTENTLSELRNNQLDAISDQGDLAVEEKQKKLEQLDIEQKRFDENYKIVQGLGSQLMDLMTQGNALIAQQKGVTGLGLIRNPRVTETINNVTAAVGVIQAGISVYNGQMNQAQNQLQTATNTLTSAYSDEIDYYKSLSNFYESQATDTNQKLVNLTNDEQDYLKSKINSLENDAQRLKDTSDMIQKAMVDPDTALAYASAGVTLNDSIATINDKLSRYAYSKELSDNSKDMAEQGYTALIGGSAPAGSEIVNITDSQGREKTYWKKPEVKASDIGFNPEVSIPQFTQNFESITGDDGYVDPMEWIAARTLWGMKGGSDSSFVSNFKRYLNPLSYKLAGLKSEQTEEEKLQDLVDSIFK